MSRHSLPLAAACVHLFGRHTVWGNIPLALTELYGTTSRGVVDLSGVTHVNFRTGARVAGNPTSELRVQYSTDNGVTWSYLGAGTAPSVNIGSVGPKSSGWIELVPGARREVMIRVVSIGGDGVSDPAFWNGSLWLREHARPRSRYNPRGTVFVILANFQRPFTNMPAALTEFPNEYHRTQVDLTEATHVRFTLNTPTAGAAGSELRLQYSIDNGATWSYPGAGTTPSVVIDTTGSHTSGWIEVVPAARREVLLRIVGIGGDGVIDPQLGFPTLLLRGPLTPSRTYVWEPFGSWSNQPLAFSEFPTPFTPPDTRIYNDLSRYSQVRVDITVTTIGAPGSMVCLQYSADDGTTWDFLGAGRTPAFTIDTLGAQSSGWIELVPGARREVMIRMAGEGGDGVITPAITPFRVFYR